MKELEKRKMALAKSPEQAADYAIATNKPFPEGEKAIATDAQAAFAYAYDVLHKRFPPGEAAIAKNPERAYEYAKYIIRGPWSAGEDAIAKNPNKALLYATTVLKERFKKGEKTILNNEDVYSILAYVREIMNNRWKEAEPILLKHAKPHELVLYAKWSGEPFIEAERRIANSDKVLDYLNEFPEREDAIGRLHREPARPPRA